MKRKRVYVSLRFRLVDDLIVFHGTARERRRKTARFLHDREGQEVGVDYEGFDLGPVERES